jgi:RNase P subunit RPR2
MSPWELEMRRLHLESLSEEDLAAAFELAVGEGTAPSNKSKTIETILQHESSTVIPSQFTRYFCTTCKKPTPHKTSKIEQEPDGSGVFSTWECSLCGTYNRVTGGKHGELFPEHIDAPSDSDAI